MSAAPMVQDDKVSTPGPREGGPRRRRSFTPTEKLDHLTAYEAACATVDGGGGGYLRTHGVYSSQISEWRKLRDAGMLHGTKPCEKIGHPTATQTDVAHLKRELELTRRKLAKTEAALEIMGKFTRSWRRSPRARTPRTSHQDADTRLRRVDRCRYLDPGRGVVDRTGPCHARPP
jgi:transposase